MYSDLVQSAILDNPLGLPQREVQRDVQEVRTRANSEGMYFLCIRLPQLAKALLQSFKDGTLTVPSGFARAKDGQYPAFLQAYWKVLFEDDGSLKDVQDLQVRAARHIWQVCALLSKLEGEIPEELKRLQAAEFETRQRAVKAITFGPLAETIISLARSVIDDIFGCHDPREQTSVRSEETTIGIVDAYRPSRKGFLSVNVARTHLRPLVMPKHGPGAVAEGTKGPFSKWAFGPVRYSDLEAEFPWYAWNIACPRSLLDPQLRKEWLSKEIRQHGVDRILAVRKDMTKDRWITCSPTPYVYAGQYMRGMLVHACASSPYRDSINTLDQSGQRRRALAGSIDGDIVTIDCENASDWYAFHLVQELFANQPAWLRMLTACRVPVGELPNGDRVEFGMYAGMGNATTFVVQTVGYFALSVAALQYQLGDHSATARRRMAALVSVFGDDIIGPAWGAAAIVEALTSVGLKINHRKTFDRGPFRESCGMDALRGVQITPTRIKKLLPTSSRDIESALAWSEYALALKDKGYGRTWSVIVQALAELGPLPWVPSGSGVVGLHTTEAWRYRVHNRLYWSEGHQSYMVKAMRAKAETRKRPLRGDRRLHRNLLTGESGEVEALRRVKPSWTLVPVS